MQLSEFLWGIAGPAWFDGYSSNPRPLLLERLNGERVIEPEPWSTTLSPGDKVYAMGASPPVLIVPAPVVEPYQGEALGNDPNLCLIGAVYWRAWKIKVTDWAKAQGLSLAKGAVVQRRGIRVPARLKHPETLLESGDLLWVKTGEEWVSHSVEAPPEPVVVREVSYEEDDCLLGTR